MVSSDPVIVEVLAAREALAREFDYDIEKIANALKADESKSGTTLQTRPARPAVPASIAS